MNVSLSEVRNKGKFTGNMTIVVDGYNAPVTAGNFVDLVDKKFYDGMEIQRADGFIVQTGDPGDDVGALNHTHLPLAATQSGQWKGKQFRSFRSHVINLE